MTQIPIPYERWHLDTHSEEYNHLCRIVSASGPSWVCTRSPGHSGPHIALFGPGGVHKDDWCAAWWDCDPDLIMDEGL